MVGGGVWKGRERGEKGREGVNVEGGVKREGSECERRGVLMGKGEGRSSEF